MSDNFREKIILIKAMTENNVFSIGERLHIARSVKQDVFDTFVPYCSGGTYNIGRRMNDTTLSKKEYLRYEVCKYCIKDILLEHEKKNTNSVLVAVDDDSILQVPGQQSSPKSFTYRVPFTY